MKKWVDMGIIGALLACGVAGCFAQGDAPDPAQMPPALRLVAVSGGLDGKGRPVSYDGVTIFADRVAYYKAGKFLEVKPMSLSRDTSIRTGEAAMIIQIEGELPCEIVETGASVTLYENVYDGYQYQFQRQP